jgi:predicted enzyme related to lactoylglutathione lyase
MFALNIELTSQKSLKVLRMLSQSKIIGFAATANPAEAMKFYGEVLGLELMEDGPYALVYVANGSSIRVQKVESVAASSYTVLGWAVEDISSTVQYLSGRGVRFERYSWLRQDAAGIWCTPDGSLVAWFKDPDGNTLSLTQFSRS